MEWYLGNSDVICTVRLLCVINLYSGEKSETLTAALYQVNDVTITRLL